MEIKLRPFKYRISLSTEKKETRNDLDNKRKIKVSIYYVYDANPYKNIFVILFQYARCIIDLKSTLSNICHA
jgi:hypothetical protein